jgi:hypothetical protein
MVRLILVGLPLGNFFAFGLGWIVSNEDFMANVESIVKLRGGWGRLGNQSVPPNNQSFSSENSSYRRFYII